jgi:hypothetical protein
MNTESNQQPAKVVQMRLRPSTIERIEHIARLMDTTNKTNVVSLSINVLENLAESVVKDNAKIYLENPDGTRSKLIIPGLNA